MTAIEELSEARSEARLLLKNIGEPLVEIPTDMLGVTEGTGGQRVWITMEHLIHIVQRILKPQ